MSVLTRSEITQYIDSQKLSFSPKLDGFQMQPHAVDLRLGYVFYIPKTWHMTKFGREALKVDPLDQNHNLSTFEMINLKSGQYFELLPKEFVIAATLEKIKINCGDIMGILYPRSSVNRRGLSVDLSGIIDVWYEGSLMIPILNNTETQTIKIYPGERICQVAFQALSSNICKKDGLKHGLAKAKYVGSNEQSISGKIDKKIEIELVRKGKIDELKKRFSI